MESPNILNPMFAMFLLIIITVIRNLIYRIQLVTAKKVKINDLKAVNLEVFPEQGVYLTKNLSNLFEMPVLFFVICLISLTKNYSDFVFTYLAWGYFSLRTVHTLIHTTYNYPVHRVIPFAFSNIVLVIMWIRFFVTYQ